MAPEQVQGKAVDARSDIYSLGVVLYESVTGRRPFVADTPLAVALMHINDPLPLPRQVNKAVPEAIERIILRAMSKDPADRFQTADDFAAALQGVSSPPPQPALSIRFAVPVRSTAGTFSEPSRRVPTGRRVGVTVAIGAVAVAIVIATWIFVVLPGEPGRIGPC